MKRTPLKRKPMKRSQPRRDWSVARAKVEAEGNVCRICGQGPAEAAHVIGREHDERAVCRQCDGTGIRALDLLFHPKREASPCMRCHGAGAAGPLLINPDHIIPLCHKHHTEYDAHSLDILSSLTREEQVEATRLVGLENARRRTAPSQYESGEHITTPTKGSLTG